MVRYLQTEDKWYTWRKAEATLLFWAPTLGGCGPDLIIYLIFPCFILKLMRESMSREPLWFIYHCIDRSISLWQHYYDGEYLKSYFMSINRVCLYFVRIFSFLYRISRFDFVFSSYLLTDHFITHLLYQWSIIFTSYIGNKKKEKHQITLFCYATKDKFELMIDRLLYVPLIY